MRVAFKFRGVDASTMTDLGVVRYFVCGSCSGVMYVLASYPIETVHMAVETLPLPKRRRTYTHLRRYTRFLLRNLEKTLRQQGVRGLYKGIGTNMLIVAPMYAASFAAYGLGLEIMVRGRRADERCTYEEIFLAGCFAPLVSTPVVAPLENLRRIVTMTRMKSERQYFGDFACSISFIRQLGARHLYRNSLAVFVRDVPCLGAFFLTYVLAIDVMKDAATDEETTILETLAAGALSGAVYRLVASPFEVTQNTRMGDAKTYRLSTRQLLRSIYRTKGWTAFFHGIGGVLLVSMPGMAGCFLGYEWTRMALQYCFPIGSVK